MTRVRALVVLGLAAALAGVVAVTRTAASPLLHTVPVAAATAKSLLVAVDERASRAFVANPDAGSVSVLDTATGTLVRTVAVGQEPDMLAVDERTGRVFVYNSIDETVAVLDARSGRFLRTVMVGSGPVGLVVDEATGRVFDLSSGPRNQSSDTGQLSVLDGRSGRLLRTVAVGVSPSALAVNARTGRVLVATTNSASSVLGSVHVLDARTGRTVHAVAVGQNPTPVIEPAALVVDARTGRAAVINGGDDSVSVLDTRCAALVRTVRVGQIPDALAVDEATGRLFVANGESGSVSVVDMGSGAVVRTVAVGANPATPVVAARSGRVFVLSSRGIRMLDARSGRLLRTVAEGQSADSAVISAPLAVDEQTGRVFALTWGARDRVGNPRGAGQVSVLDARSGALLRTIPVGVRPDVVAVDERAGRVLVLNMGGVARSSDPWSWVPGWLRRLVPLFPHPSPTRVLPASVSVIDASG